jgi:MFS family permease
MQDESVPLRHNRDFNLLWTGQVVSGLGTRISDIAFPLLVLSTTGSPIKAGIVGFAWALPLFALTLFAGALVDRLNRKRLMIVCDVVRSLAFASLVAGIALGHVVFAHVVVVALIEGTGYVFFSVAERSAIRQVVRDEQLPAALARNQAREYISLLAGQPIGGVLFAVGRAVPFLVNCVSYFLSVVSLAFVRVEFQEERATPPGRVAAEIKEGLAWFWRQPFIRDSQLVVTGSDFTLNALYLVVIVLARERGASPLVIGLMFAFLGVGGMLGTMVAPWLARRLSMRQVVVTTMWLGAVLVPLLLAAPGRITPGVLYGSMMLLHPTWGAVVGAYRLRMTPDAMQGRIQGITVLFSAGAVPFGTLLAGFLLQAYGATATVLVLTGVMALAALWAFASPAIRNAPDRGRPGARVAPVA